MRLIRSPRRARMLPRVVVSTIVIAGTIAGTACVARRPTSIEAAADGVRAGDCFDLRGLSAADRVDAERLLLNFGDREGLYTLAGGLKPMSSDVGDLQVRIGPDIDRAALAQLDRQRRLASHLSCGDLGMFVEVFTATQRRRDSSEVRASSLVVFHRRALRAVIERHADFFATLGVTPATDPREVVAAVENAPRAPRWRGYGYLFGYPDAAVNFFVDAGIEGDRTGTLVPRDFRRVETVARFASGSGDSLSTFVYAVPKGAPVSDDERQLQERAARILAQYRAARARHIRADSSGAAALWREWVRALGSVPAARDGGL